MSADLIGLVNQLRSTLGKMEVALGAIADAIVWTGTDGKVQWCNAAFDRLVARSHITVLGKQLSELLLLQQNGRPVPVAAYPNLQVLQSEHITTEYEYQMDSDVRILEISGNRVELANQDWVAVLVIRDVTQTKQQIIQRQKTEATLRESEVKFRSIVENANDIITLIDLDGKLTYVSPNLEKVLGYLPTELEGNIFLDYIHPDDQARCIQIFQQVLAGEQQPGVEYRARHKAGFWQWQSTNLATFQAANGDTLVLSVSRDLTASRQAAAKLQRSNAILKAQQEASIDGILVVDESRNVVSYNQRFCQLWNIPDAIIQQGNSQALLDWVMQQLDQPQEFLAKVEYLYAHPEATSRDEIVLRDGRILDRYSASVRSPSGEYYGRIWYFRDISDRKHIEAALRQREQEFRALVENAPDVIIRFDRHARYRYINARVEREMGLAPIEFIGKTPQDMGFPEAISRYWQTIIDQVFATAQEMEIELELPLPHRKTYQSFHVVPEFDPQGAVESVLTICRDLTDRKRSEEALRRRAQQDSLLSRISRQFVDQDWDTAIAFTLEELAEFLDTERCRIYIYSAAEQQSRMTHEWCKVSIQPLAELPVVPVSQAPWLYSQVLYKAQPLVVSHLDDLPPEAFAEAAGLRNLGVQSIAIVPMLHSQQVVGFIGVDRVTSAKIWTQEEINLIQLVGELIAIAQSRHKAEAELRVAKDAAESANRAKSAFLANMSHELRTPLNAILGFAQLMERDSTLTPRQRDFLGTINRSGEHLLTIINDVLEMSKIEAGRVVLMPVPCNLYQLLQAVEEMFQVRAAAKQLTLGFSRSSNLPQFILIDEGKLRQVLINLLSNAIKFTDAGCVTLQASFAAEVLQFEIQDTGRGIAPDELEHLFQPFVQTSSATHSKEGTGLGLTISRQFVQLMGGDIEVNSTVGVGSSFRFTVNAIFTEPFETAVSVPPHQVLELAPNQRPYRLLVVDDRPENADLLLQLFGSVGFEVRSAANGQEAIVQWQAWHPDLIWMDMRMPVMDGYAATQRIRQLEPERQTKIIALTASAFEEQRSRILAVGCDDLVRKPFREQILFDKLKEHLGVEYVYADFTAATTSALTLQPTALQVMSAAWIAALHQAAIEVDAELIGQLIEQIPGEHSALASGLMDLSDRFCFDEILELTQALLRHDSHE